MTSDQDLNAVVSPVSQNSGLPPLILQYWQTVMRWRVLMLMIIAAVLVLSVVITLLTPPLYTAQLQLQIDRQQKQITKVEGVEAQSSFQDQEFYETQYTLLKARPLAERVARDLSLFDNALFLEAHGEEGNLQDTGDLSKSKADIEAANRKLIVDKLLENFDVEPIRNSKLVNIKYTSRDADLSAKIANQWAKAFISSSLDRQLSSTVDARKFLEERLSVLRTRLEESERSAVAYASRNGIVSLGDSKDADGKVISSRTLVASRLENLAGALNEATAARILASAKASSGAGATTESVTSMTLATLRSQRATTAADLAKKRVQLEDGHPYVQELKRQLDTTDQAIRVETQRIADARRNEFREAVAQEEQLKGQVTALRSSYESESKANIQYAALLRDADTNRQIYDALLQRYKEIGVAGQVGVNNISIVEPAFAPDRPSSPNLLVNIALALIAGLIAAAIATVILEQVDEGVHNPSEVKGRLGLPMLGITPYTDQDTVEGMKDVKSHIFDTYFAIHSNLAFSTAHGFPRSLAVSSTLPSEGKTSTSISLSIVLGRTGKSVLIIDADLRKSSVHSRIGVSNEHGLSNYLAGQGDWRSYVQPSQFKGVSVLATGPMPPSAAELLSGDSLGNLIKEAMGEFDHVVVDAPPVLGMADAPLIVKTVEAVVYVVQAKGASIRGIQSSVQRLAIANAKIAGVVFTKVDQKAADYGYGYGYGYGASEPKGALN